MVGLCQHALAFGMRGKVPTTGFVLGALAKATSLLHHGGSLEFVPVLVLFGARPMLPNTSVFLLPTGELFNVRRLHVSCRQNKFGSESWEGANTKHLFLGGGLGG